MLISLYEDECLKLPRLSPGPDLFPSSCAGVSLPLSRVTVLQWPPTPRVTNTAGNATQAFWISGQIEWNPKWDPKRNKVLEEKLRTSDCPGDRDFLHNREMESEAVNVCQIFSTITQEKGNTSPQTETFLLWVENCLWHPCSYWQPSRVIEAWIAVGLIPLSCPWAWQAVGAWLFSSQPQPSFLTFLYTADNTSQYISWAPHKGNHALEHEIITVPDLWSVILCNFSFQ